MANTVLYIVNSERYVQGLVDIVKNEIKSKNIVYVTTNKPYSHISNTFERYGIPSNRIFFIDCISKHVGESTAKEPDNCIYLEGPQGLTQISIAVSESIEAMKSPKALLLDSLSVMLVYNDAKTMSKFSNFLINKMRSAGVDTIILALESDVDKDIIKQIESYADEVKRG